jgi:hypothetical protein
MMRTYQYHTGECESCHEVPDNGALWVTTARVLDFGVPGLIFEPNPSEPKMCDDCELIARKKETCRAE